MKKAIVVAATILLLSVSTITHAVTIETVPVGNPRNRGDLSGAGAGGYGTDRVCGAVGYIYNIGKYEVTTRQYAEFLNKVAKTDSYGLYNTDMWSSSSGYQIQRSGTPDDYRYSAGDGWENKPITFISYWDAARFANWLHNGQPAGAQGPTTTEDGAYTLNGYVSHYLVIPRNPGAKWFIPTEDEWYKAAYYKGGGTNAGYWDYPMQSNLATTPSNSVIEPDPGNNANFLNQSSTGRTNVGEFENSESAYGTFDQGGNTNEWTEDAAETFWRWKRGGSHMVGETDMRASFRHSTGFPETETYAGGFRLASAVPEPSSFVVLAAGLIPLVRLRKRKSC